MKLGILCTMMKRFGTKGFYNSQEIGLGRALAKKGHQVSIYKGVEDKDQVDRAKRLLMERYGIDEPEAHRRIQQYSMTHGIRMAEYAAALLQGRNNDAG